MFGVEDLCFYLLVSVCLCCSRRRGGSEDGRCMKLTDKRGTGVLW